MLVVLLVTGIAKHGRIFEFVVDVALVALHIDMLAHQLEFGLVVIKGYGFPLFFYMALRAISPQTTLMFVILLVAVVAIAWRIAVFLSRLVAVRALDLLFQMTALERVIGFVMVEFGVVEFIYLGVAPLVIGMTVFALLARLHATMKTALFGEVLAYFLVAIGTQLRLRVLVKLLVALLAILLDLGMALDDFSGHQQYVCLRLKR